MAQTDPGGPVELYDVRDVGLQVGQTALIEERFGHWLPAVRREMLGRRLRRWAVFLVLGLLVCGVFGVGCLTVWADQFAPAYQCFALLPKSATCWRDKSSFGLGVNLASDQEQDAMLDGAENRVQLK